MRHHMYPVTRSNKSTNTSQTWFDTIRPSPARPLACPLPLWEGCSPIWKCRPPPWCHSASGWCIPGLSDPPAWRTGPAAGPSRPLADSWWPHARTDWREAMDFPLCRAAAHCDTRVEGTQRPQCTGRWNHLRCSRHQAPRSAARRVPAYWPGWSKDPNQTMAALLWPRTKKPTYGLIFHLKYFF